MRDFHASFSLQFGSCDTIEWCQYFDRNGLTGTALQKKAATARALRRRFSTCFKAFLDKRSRVFFVVLLNRNLYKNIFPPQLKLAWFTPIPHPEARTAERLGATPEMPPMTTVTPLRSVRRRSTAPGGQRQNTCQRCFPPHLCASFLSFYKTMHSLLHLLVFFLLLQNITHETEHLSQKKTAVFPPWFFGKLLQNCFDKTT